VDKFEIGVVYQKGSKFFLAVDQSTLVACKSGSLTRVRPTTTYNPVRSMTVEKLCAHWDLSLDQFDDLMSEHLSPEPTSIKPRPRGTRRRKEADEEYWRRYRTGRIVCPKV